MAFGPTATVQYWAVTTSNTKQANGPMQRLWADVTGTLVLTSGDGSTLTLTVPARTWMEFKYPITTVGTSSTATGIIAEGWAAPTTTSLPP